MAEWSAKQSELVNDLPYDRTLDWLEGTPRSGKTTAGIMRFAIHLAGSRDTNHLVVAYSAEQAYRLIMDGDGFGLLHIFKGFCRTSHDDSRAGIPGDCRTDVFLGNPDLCSARTGADRDQ